MSYEQIFRGAVTRQFLSGCKFRPFIFSALLQNWRRESTLMSPALSGNNINFMVINKESKTSFWVANVEVRYFIFCLYHCPPSCPPIIMSGSHLIPAAGLAWCPRCNLLRPAPSCPPSPEPALCKLCGSGKKTGESFLQEEIVLNRKTALLNINLEFYKGSWIQMKLSELSPSWVEMIGNDFCYLKWTWVHRVWWLDRLNMKQKQTWHSIHNPTLSVLVKTTSIVCLVHITNLCQQLKLKYFLLCIHVPDTGPVLRQTMAGFMIICIQWHNRLCS